jgi:hypothetical protein
MENGKRFRTKALFLLLCIANFMIQLKHMIVLFVAIIGLFRDASTTTTGIRALSFVSLVRRMIHSRISSRGCL